MDNNTLILVFYVNVGNATTEEIPDILKIVSDSIGGKNDNDNVAKYIVPVRKDMPETIVCINPKMISGNEYKKIKEKMNDYQKALDEFLNGDY